MHHPGLASVLVGCAVGLAVLFGFGLILVKDALERLHFSSSITSFSAGLIVVAVWLDDPNWQARIKATLIVIVLFFMNSILSHATARAARIREQGQFDPLPDEHFGRISRDNPTGASQ